VPPGYLDCIIAALESMVATTEGTASQPDGGYGTLVGGDVNTAPHPFHWIEGQTFSAQNPWNMPASDVATLTGNPGLRVDAGFGSESTAFGRYQITGPTAQSLGMVFYSPAWQDWGAAQLMDQHGMIQDAMAGQIVQAIWDGNTTWASLPDSPYNQHPMSWEATIDAFQNALNTLPECQ
jgi:muramidase (phage lysozyme)